MPLITVCPNCQAAFRVVPDQLKIRRGLVRCGECRQIFSGIDGLRSANPAQTETRVAPSAPIAPSQDATVPLVAAATVAPEAAPGPTAASPETTISTAFSVQETSPPEETMAAVLPQDLAPAATVPIAGPGTRASDQAASIARPPPPVPPETASHLIDEGILDDLNPPTIWLEPQLELPEEEEREFRLPAAHEPTPAGASGVGPIPSPRQGEVAAAGFEPMLPRGQPEAAGEARMPGTRPLVDPDSQRLDLDFLDLPASPDEPDRPAEGPTTRSDDAPGDTPGAALPGARADGEPMSTVVRAMGERGPDPPHPAQVPDDQDDASGTGQQERRASPAAGMPVTPRPTQARTPAALPSEVRGQGSMPSPAGAASLGPGPAPLEAESESPAVDFFARSDKARGFRSRGNLIAALASGLLSLCLALQIGLASRDMLAVQLPAIAEPLRTVAAAFGLTVQAPRDLQSLALESFELQTEGRPGLLRLSALIRNQAGNPVRWPAMELSLNDAQGALVVRKVLLPQDYLGGDTAAARRSGVPPGQEQPVQVALNLDGPAPSAYSVKLFYP